LKYDVFHDALEAIRYTNLKRQSDIGLFGNIGNEENFSQLLWNCVGSFTDIGKNIDLIFCKNYCKSSLVILPNVKTSAKLIELNFKSTKDTIL
jgi:hypothetical protein